MRRPRRAFAGALTAAGAALLLYAAGAWGASAVARDRARADWNATEARRFVVDARRAADPGRPLIAAPGSPIARLRVPRLGLDEVVVEGVDESSLRAGPGHVTWTPMPGAAGNSVISAHRDLHFRPLADIQVGDSIVTEAQGPPVVWIVRSRRVVAADAPALFATAAPTLTLTTCWPIRWFGPAPERLIVEASPLP